MLGSLTKAMSADDIEITESGVISDLNEDRSESAQRGIQKLLRVQAHNRGAALAIVRIVESSDLSIEQGLELFEAVFRAHRSDSEIAAALGDAIDQVRDIDELNAPAPESALFAELAEVLAEFARSTVGTPEELSLLSALASTTRMMARQRDDIALSSYRRLAELAPDKSHHHYNLGLFYKTRGLFREGMLANQAAARLSTEPQEAHDWNLGICATGAGEGSMALEVWKRIGQKIEIGLFGLPQGGYPDCKVKLAERPLAERDSAHDSPGLEESVWVERLSPCHGIVRSALYQSLGVDYGDVVLFDGAPITHHTYGEKQIPVFPHLSTLVRAGYRFYDFAGTQKSKGQLADVSQQLQADAVVYPHTEQYVVLCNACWRSEETDHTHHKEHDEHVLIGRIVAPPEFEPAELLRQLDSAMADRVECRIYAPDLCQAAGLTERAEVERGRFNMIVTAKGS